MCRDGDIHGKSELGAKRSELIPEISWSGPRGSIRDRPIAAGHTTGKSETAQSAGFTKMSKTVRSRPQREGASVEGYCRVVPVAPVMSPNIWLKHPDVADT